MRAKWVPLSFAALLAILPACTSSNDTDGKSSASVSPSAGDAAAGPYGKYNQTISMQIAKTASSQNTNMPAGDTPDDNEFYRYLGKRLNVKVTNAWRTETQDAYNQKLSVSMASRDLPDAFVVNETQLKQLVQAGSIADLTDAYKNYASPLYKSYYESYGDRLLKHATFNGKLMALSSTNIGGQFDCVWIRQDWLDKLGLQPPKSLDDLIKIAQAFVNNDPDGNGKKDTYGFTGLPSIYGQVPFTFDPILGSLHAYEGQWLTDASGKVTFGSIMPEMKTALAKLHDLYEAGLIDQEFAVRKDPKQLVASGQLGIVFGPWYTPNGNLRDSVKNDPKAEWKPYLAPLDDQGKFNVYDQNPNGNYLVVRKDYPHPEAVVKVENVEIDGIRQVDQEAGNVYKGLGVLWSYWPFSIQVDSEDTVYKTHMELKNAIEAKDPSKLNDEHKQWYDAYSKDQANPKKDPVAWALALSRMAGADLLGANQIAMHRNAFFGITPTMQTKWENLRKLENETFLKIIMGQSPVDSFDNFVTQWKQLGGDQITKEVQETLSQK